MNFSHDEIAEIEVILLDGDSSQNSRRTFVLVLGSIVARYKEYIDSDGLFDTRPRGPKPDSAALAKAAEHFEAARRALMSVDDWGRDALGNTSPSAYESGGGFAWGWATVWSEVLAGHMRAAAVDCERSNPNRVHGRRQIERETREWLTAEIFLAMSEVLEEKPKSTKVSMGHRLFSFSCAKLELPVGGDWFDYFKAGMSGAEVMKKAGFSPSLFMVEFPKFGTNPPI